MSDTDPGNEDENPKGVLYTLVSDGDWLFRKGEYKKAIDSYTKSLSVRPEDRSCYVGLSKCYLLMGNPEMALKEAENSLKGDKSFFEGLYQKAEVLYYMGEFEFAKMCYHRGLKIRPEIQRFRVGIQKAQEAIENATGNPSSVKLENKGDLSFFQKDDEEANKTLKTASSKMGSEYPMNSLPREIREAYQQVRRKYPATAIQQMMMEKKPQKTTKRQKNEKKEKRVLGEFYNDKKYLEVLLKDKDLGKVITKKGESLQSIIKDSLSYLETCTEFRNHEKPIEVQKVDKSNHKETRANSSSTSERLQFFQMRLDEIESDLLCSNARASLKKAEEVMKTVQTWSPTDVPDKNEFLQILHRSIGNAHFELGDMDKALNHYHKDLELAKQCKLHEDQSRALDNMGRVHVQMGQFEQAIECQEKRIPLVHDAVERTWMFYELGRWHLELNRFEEAQKYGLRSVATADLTGDVKWNMNSNVLLAESELKLENYESSISHFELALSYAKQQEDDAAIKAIQEALDEAKQHLPQNEDVQDNA